MEEIKYPEPKQDYKVLVRCFTYNQSKYITDALNGFAMQQTDFPYVCLVMDDSSTDGEQEIIKQWMNDNCDMQKSEVIDIPTSVVILVPHKTNTSCTFAFYLLKQNLYGTGDKKMNHVYPWREHCVYEAMCEGDDYWIDSLKLQKQANFLDDNIEYGMCYTQCKRYDQTTDRIVDEAWGGSSTTFEDFLDSNNVPTLTNMSRVSWLFKYNEDVCPLEHNWPMGDYPLWLYLSHESKVKYLNFVSGVYRITDNSASHFAKESQYVRFIESSISIVQFFVSLFNYTLDEEAYISKRKSRLASNLAFIYNDREGAISTIRGLRKKTIGDYIKLVVFSSSMLFKIYKKTLNK